MASQTCPERERERGNVCVCVFMATTSGLSSWQLALIASATNCGDLWLKPSMPLAFSFIKTQRALLALTVTVTVTVTATVMSERRFIYYNGIPCWTATPPSTLSRLSPPPAAARHSVSRVAFISNAFYSPLIPLSSHCPCKWRNRRRRRWRILHNHSHSFLDGDEHARHAVLLPQYKSNKSKASIE